MRATIRERRRPSSIASHDPSTTSPWISHAIRRCRYPVRSRPPTPARLSASSAWMRAEMSPVGDLRAIQLEICSASRSSIPTTFNHTGIRSAASCGGPSGTTLKTFDSAARLTSAKPSMISTPAFDEFTHTANRMGIANLRKSRKILAGRVRWARRALSVWLTSAHRRSRKASTFVTRESFVRHVPSWRPQYCSMRSGPLAAAERCILGYCAIVTR